ncbi:MAG: rRNA maturation RNase YbeY [Salinisphaera sp.]|jgi:probable rRNA maturation factor|nr:rRNA maturation RNase YbeY [Salinisphaera sp.]
MTLDFSIETGPDLSAEQIDQSALFDAAGAALHDAGIDVEGDDIEIALRLVDDAESARLNGQYRDRHYATNVLSFPADVCLPGLRVLGDLVICLPVVTREAAEQGKSQMCHLTHMTVHGTLHLLGFDHIGDDEAQIMEAAERRAMAALGYDDPYVIRAAD